jgi:uridine kinase
LFCPNRLCYSGRSGLVWASVRKCLFERSAPTSKGRLRRVQQHDPQATEAHDQLVLAIRRLIVDRQPPLLIAIDGRSGSGKSKLARSVAREVGAAVVLADDFFGGGDDSHWLSVSVEGRVDHVLDWRRLRREALEPLLNGRRAKFHPLDFEPGVGWVGWKDEIMCVPPVDVVILEGAYSARPELEDLIDLSVLVEASEPVRTHRLLARQGEDFMRRWHAVWDDAENLYFGRLRPPELFDLVVKGD